MNASRIHTGFAKGLRGLNTTLPSEDMMMTPVGRAYKRPGPHNDVNTSDFYASAIHVDPMGENTHYHLLLAFERDRALKTGGIYMGAAGIVNLSYIGVLKPAAAILFDINPLQALFWDHAIETAAANPDLEGFLRVMRVSDMVIHKRIRKLLGPVKFSANNLEHTLAKFPAGEVFRGTDASFTFLKHPPHDDVQTRFWKEGDRYAHFHALARDGAVGALTLDVMDAKAWAQLADYFNQHARGGVTTLYISNILETLSWTGRDVYDRPALQKAREKTLANIISVADKDGLNLIDHHGGLSEIQILPQTDHRCAGGSARTGPRPGSPRP